MAGRLKWFSPEKGFGFIAVPEVGDVYLHGNILAAFGADHLAEGSLLRFRTREGVKGKQVSEILAVDEPPPPSAGAPALAVTRAGFPARRTLADLPSADLAGCVKWWNAERGYGFITPANGAKDIFIHVSVLTRAGLRELHEGQAVRVHVVESYRGLEVGKIEVD